MRFWEKRDHSRARQLRWRPFALVGALSLGAAVLGAFRQPMLNAADATSAGSVPFLRLLANPERFEDKDVRTVGFLRLEFEGTALYFHEEDARNRITPNALWVSLDEAQMKEHSRLSGRYVVIEATFDSTRRGHMGVFPGTLGEIKAIRSWTP